MSNPDNPLRPHVACDVPLSHAAIQGLALVQRLDTGLVCSSTHLTDFAVAYTNTPTPTPTPIPTPVPPLPVYSAAPTVGAVWGVIGLWLLLAVIVFQGGVKHAYHFW